MTERDDPPGPMPPGAPTTGDRPDYGPGGYLPERAAKRARKIILRERMGLGWPLAAVAAAVVVLAAGAWLVLTQLGEPPPPFVAVGELGAIGTASATVVTAPGGERVLVVRSRATLAVFLAPAEPVVLCAESGLLEGARGSAWQLTGARVAGDGDALARLPSRIHDGRLYVDPTSPRPVAPPARPGATPRCTVP